MQKSVCIFQNLKQCNMNRATKRAAHSFWPLEFYVWVLLAWCVRQQCSENFVWSIFMCILHLLPLSRHHLHVIRSNFPEMKTVSGRWRAFNIHCHLFGWGRRCVQNHSSHNTACRARKLFFPYSVHTARRVNVCVCVCADSLPFMSIELDLGFMEFVLV